MAASGRKDGADTQDPWAWDLPLGDGRAQGEDRLWLARPDIAHRGETGLEGDAGPVRRLQRDRRIGLIHQR